MSNFFKLLIGFIIIAFVISIFAPFIAPIVFALIIFLILRKKARFNYYFNNMNIPNIKISSHFIVYGLIGLVVIILLALSIVVIPPGQTGVYHIFGRVGEKEYSSGIHLKNPLAQIEKMSVRTQDYTMTIVPGEGVKYSSDAITALTKEGLKVDLDITVLYHLIENKASDIFKNIGVEYEEKLLRPQIRASIREIIAQYEAKEVYSQKRAEAGQAILDYLKQRLDPRGIAVEEVLMRDVRLPEKLAQSIEQKLQAEQEAQRMEFVLQREQKEAERKRIEAQGQRDAQQIISQGLTKNYLNYLYIKELENRQGTIYIPTDPESGLPMFKGF